MKLNLNGSKKPASAPSAEASAPSAPFRGAATARAASAAPRNLRAETYGRSCAPPPPGSSYWEFLHWSSEGGMPLPDDTDLAISLWAGTPPRSEEADAAAPGMR
jgi:hypothetical protein